VKKLLSRTAKSRERMFVGHIINNAFFFSANVLGQTAASRCENFPTFQGLTPSPLSGCCWWLGKIN